MEESRPSVNIEKIGVVIIAAGYSSRMGENFKPLLPLGDQLVLEHSISLFTSNGIKDVRVVVGFRADDLIPLLDALNVRFVHNKHFDRGMFSSVKEGVASLSSDCEAFFMMPVDIPLVRRNTVCELLNAGKTDKILYPVFRNERGHPPLIPSHYIPEILAWSSEGGLQTFLEAHEDQSMNIPVADEGVLIDLDTPADYGVLLRRLANMDIPSVPECKEFLVHIFNVNENIYCHCAKVAAVANHLCEILNERGERLDPELVSAGAWLHDIVRTQSNHARRGAKILRMKGFHRVADVIENHPDIIIREHEKISEREIVYFADKLVYGDKLVSIEKRFDKKAERYKKEPEAVRNIEARKNRALKSKRRIEEVIGRPLETVFRFE